MLQGAVTPADSMAAVSHPIPPPPPAFSQADWLTFFYLPVTLWIVGVIITVIILMRRYTFGKWTKENPNPYENESFAMPRGVMRGILSMSLLFIVLLLEIVSLQDRGFSEGNMKELLIAFQMMLAFYFGSKVMHHVTSADERKNSEMATALSTSAKPVDKPIHFEDDEAKG